MITPSLLFRDRRKEGLTEFTRFSSVTIRAATEKVITCIPADETAATIQAGSRLTGINSCQEKGKRMFYDSQLNVTSSS